MEYDKNSFLSGISVGIQLFGWAQREEYGTTRGIIVSPIVNQITIEGVLFPIVLIGEYIEIGEE